MRVNGLLIVGNRFLKREEYYERPIAYFHGQTLGIIRTWVFHYSDGTEEVLRMVNDGSE